MSSSYECSKCGYHHYEVDEIATTGTGFSKFIDLQNRTFTAITCKKCRYTELYKGETSSLRNVLDFLSN